MPHCTTPLDIGYGRFLGVFAKSCRTSSQVLASQTRMENAPKNNRHNLEPESLQDLQVCLYDWQSYNFGEDQDNDLTMLGIYEEAGELCHAQLKLEQNIRGDTQKHEEEMIDAIGDMMIYSMNYLSGMDAKFPSFASRKDVKIAGEDDQKIVRAAVKSTFRLAAKLDGKDGDERRVRNVLHQLDYLCALKGWDLEKVVRGTWKLVSQRDWKMYPKTGRPSVAVSAHDEVEPIAMKQSEAQEQPAAPASQ